MTGTPGLIDEINAAALAAGAAILEIYAQDFAVARKADASPVTQADQLAEAIILEALRRATPDIAVVAEELAAAGHLPASAPERFWLVDPLDGTKEFIARNGEFTVNIALIERGRPVLGVVYAPALGVTYWAFAGRAFRRLGPTMEWDTAAAQCILEAAGGRVTDLHGHPMLYNKPSLLNPAFLARGDT